MLVETVSLVSVDYLYVGKHGEVPYYLYGALGEGVGAVLDQGSRGGMGQLFAALCVQGQL